MTKAFLCRNITTRLLWMSCLFYTTVFPLQPQFRVPISSEIAT